MFFNHTSTVVGVGIVMLALASGVANAKCGNHAGHGGVSSRGGAGKVAEASPETTEGRAAFIEGSFDSGSGAGNSPSSGVYQGRDLGLGGHHRAGR